MERIKLLVLLIVMSVFKCLAMSVDELEDFKNYLKRTSQLDQNLKKGVDPDDDDDEGDSASDHAWEESGKFEGDLILNDPQRRLIVENVAEGLSRNGLKDGTKRWPNNEVTYYIQKEHFTNDQVRAIKDGIDDLARASCVKFRPYQRGDRDAVVIQGSRRGCFSQVGYQGGYQVLNLSGRHPVGRGCFRHGTVVHELLHTLGFYHMQSSPDRDDFIDVLWENILQPARHNFRKYNSFSVSDFGVGYDYDSVLHYSRRAFSSNGQDTLVPKQNGASIGQRVGLSDKDTQKLNKMYCDVYSDTQIADEESVPKPGKKNNPKNKPFDGYGIGYHQGKTVVIKLLPAPETYKLPDVPSFHVFDYFSKTPETMPSSQVEGIGIGTDITYSPPSYYTKKYASPTTNNVHAYNKHMISEIIQQNVQNNRNHNKEGESAIQYNEQNKISQSPNYESSGNTDSSGTSDQPDSGLSEAYDRLAKIVKYHVYPSQSTDFKLLKFNKDHSEFYTVPKLTETDVFTPTISPTQQSVTLNIRPAKHFIENLYETSQNSDPTHETTSPSKVKNNSQEKYIISDKILTQMDSSYRNSFPIKMKSDKLYEQMSLERLKQRDNYSNLFKSVLKDVTMEPHTLIDENVPINEDQWIVRNMYKQNFNTDALKDNDYHYDGSNEENTQKEKNKQYSLFSTSVPLNEDWYTPNYSKRHNLDINIDVKQSHRLIDDNR